MAELFQRNEQGEKSVTKYNKTQPLISVVIISYNNIHYLYHAIKSVLEQNYGNIEITISDDASVGYTIEDSAQLVCLAAADLIFEQNHVSVDGVERVWKKHKTINQEELTQHRTELWEWEKQTRGNYYEAALKIIEEYFPHIRNLNFRRNSENLGTVKHLKTLKKNATGKYIMFLAADDKLHDKNVIFDMVEYFEQLPENAYVLTSQCGMYDEHLDQLLYYAVNDELKEIITKSTPDQLFAELTDWCIIPAAGTIYKKKAFEVYGDLDDRYCLIEDWTYFLKLTRNGGQIHFYDRLTYMHRDGGISHGNNTGGNLAYQHYLEDSILLTQQEILPYLDKLMPAQKKKALTRYRNACREYGRKFQFAEMSISSKIGFLVHYWRHYIPKLFIAIVEFCEYRAKWAFLAGVVALMLSFLISLSSVQDASSLLLYYLLGCGGLILFWGAVLSKTLFAVIKLISRN